MPKCNVCGKKGFFLKLNSKGQCAECEKRIRQEEIEAKKRAAAIKEQEDQQATLAEEVGKTCHEDYRLLPDCIITDIETTGLDFSEAVMIELSAIKIVNGKVAAAFSKIIKQPIKLPKKITSLTGITQYMMDTDGVPEKEVMEEFDRFVGDLPLVGHNISDFDIIFINASALHYLKKRYSTYFDTLKMARYLLPYASNHKLEHLKFYVPILFGTSHRALGDCETTLNLFNFLRNVSVADMVKWHINGKPILTNDKFPKYISGFYPEGEASNLQQKLIDIGFLVKADPFLSLDSFKVDRLKEVLKNNGLSTQGKKQDLITRIEENIPQESLNIESIYIPSEIGLEHEQNYHAMIKRLPVEI